MGIVLSGGDGDGAAGLRAIKGQGGVALIQNPEEAEKPAMPYTAMMTDHPDACLSVEEIAERVAALCCAVRPTVS
jgi:chemotaxis response regulator CheB